MPVVTKSSTDGPIQGEVSGGPRNIGVRRHLTMSPREFVESLLKPDQSLRMLGPKGTPMAARRGEIEGWLWAESTWPTWGPGGKAFVLRAGRAVDEGNFEAWLGSLKR